MTVALQVITGVHVGSDGGFVSGRVARATPVAGQFIDHLTVDATVLSSPISAVDGTWSLTLICGVVYDIKIDRWAVQTIRVTDDATLDFSWYLEQSLELVNGGSQIPSSLTPAMVTALSHKLTRPISAPAGKQLTFDAEGDVVASSYDVGAAGGGNFPSPPDQTGNWAYVSLAGELLWLELVEVTGGSVPTAQDGTAAAIGAETTSQTGTASASGAGVTTATSSELASQTGAASATGTGATAATGSAATSEAGAATPIGSGTTTAVGSEGSAEAGTATSFVLSPGTALATGAEATAEAGSAAATGTGTTSATGTQATSEYGTATASATSSGSATATSSEGTSQTGTATATGSGITAATGVQGTSETGTATASGGGGGSTITENFDTAIASTYSTAGAYPSNMAATATVQGWTIGSSGTDPGTFTAYDWFIGANIATAVGGFSGNGLFVIGCLTQDSETNLLAYSGYKLTKTWTGTFSSGTFSLKYKIPTGNATTTIKVNGVSVGALTQNGAWQTATIALTSPASVVLEVECAPTANAISNPPQIVIDSITYS